jgi:hypothetical protein
MMTTKA